MQAPPERKDRLVRDWTACVSVGGEWSKVRQGRYVFWDVPWIFSRTRESLLLLFTSLANLLVQVARHIFTGLSTAHGGDACGVWSCNTTLHNMERVESVHIAYAAVLVSETHRHMRLWLMFIQKAQFAISSQTCWGEKDGRFNYCKFYYMIIDLVDECKDISWKDELLQHYNM